MQCADGAYYIGITNNLEKRLKAHLNGTASKYTAARLPVKICYRRGGLTRSQALKEEIILKSWTHSQKEQLIKRTMT